MTPTQARRLVGQPDIVERLREYIPLASYDGVVLAHVSRFEGAADEIERLRTALRAVRATTCPRWRLQIIRDALREGDGT